MAREHETGQTPVIPETVSSCGYAQRPWNPHEGKENKEGAVDGVSNVGRRQVVGSDLVDRADKVCALAESAERAGRENVGLLLAEGCRDRRIVPLFVAEERLGDFGGIGKVARGFRERSNLSFDGGAVGGEGGLGLGGRGAQGCGVAVGVDEPHAFPEAGDGDLISGATDKSLVHGVGEALADGDAKGGRGNGGARDDEVLEDLPSLAGYQAVIRQQLRQGRFATRNNSQQTADTNASS